MFDQTFVDANGTARKSLAASFALQTIGVTVVLVATLFFTEALPQARLSSFLVAPLPPIAAPEAPRVERTTQSARQVSAFSAPARIPKAVAMIEDSELPAADAIQGAVPGLSTGAASSAVGSFLGALPETPKPQTARVKEPEAAVAPARPVPVSAGVQAANIVRKVVPVYPPLARQARISGKVRFTAIIGTDGSIQNLQLIDGHPLLIQAAREAILQWIYKPTLLSGKPVEVITQIEVNFTLGQ